MRKRSKFTNSPPSLIVPPGGGGLDGKGVEEGEDQVLAQTQVPSLNYLQNTNN